ncbi:tRNA pseudouridine55 synthase [Paenibacillus sp. UNCCL117]|uniref:tRNA pseudouridine(55) synthase TruB n=1 Tax=unclassified Paenibacillus TaxID=185978 RepID=UPI00087FD92B|nr:MULTISPECIES: tRNA pseudouridine(55) synthase TruB [unclassified Paenibacillus]SDC87706.1 tRNA pseudouridine55 synthase [Paenibacillus sp. cl123]SFW28137.1 tRNA pseudouridine55 synthase [Paenibacillus sp. UNCCL117]
MTLDGILPIWKPKGYTSHDVVAKARRILKIKRIGHTGTLDPMVTGVLPLCIGKATRVVEYIQDLPKEYEACLWLGLRTDTEDLTGTVLDKDETVKERVSPEAAAEAVRHFIGEIEQVPPMYSAVKVEGKRLYELARQGLEVERQSRQVTIHSIAVLETDWDVEYPTIRFRVLCSKGTYIRTLCADIGKSLGVPAVMGELVRTSTGSMTREQCLTLEDVQELAAAGSLPEKLIPIEEALRHLPSVCLSAEQTLRARQGQRVRLNAAQLARLQELTPEQLGRIAGFADPAEQAVGVFEWNQEMQGLQAVKIFSQEP